jgi:hypothetical protein
MGVVYKTEDTEPASTRPSVLFKLNINLANLRKVERARREMVRVPLGGNMTLVGMSMSYSSGKGEAPVH